MNHKKGFSLVEVLVSLAVFSIFICSIFTIKNMIIKESKDFEKKIMCSNIQRCLYKTFLNRYSYDSLKNYKDKTLYVPLENNTLYKIPLMDIQYYEENIDAKDYISIFISEKECLVFYVKIVLNNKEEKNFDFMKGKLNEKGVCTY